MRDSQSERNAFIAEPFCESSMARRYRRNHYRIVAIAHITISVAGDCDYIDVRGLRLVSIRNSYQVFDLFDTQISRLRYRKEEKVVIEPPKPSTRPAHIAGKKFALLW